MNTLWPLLVVLGLAGWCVPAQAQDTTPIYYCTDAKGKRSFSDRACLKGQQQEVRRLPTPKSRPAIAPVRHIDPVHAALPPAPQVVVITPPRPLYECVTPEGEMYTSDSPEGRPRFVPLWTLGYPVLVEQTYVTPGGGHLTYSNGRVDGSFHSGGLQHAVVPTAAGYGAGTWIRDQCHVLPQADTCGRLRDQLSSLRTRFFNAMPSERDRITVQERAITERLNSDCR